VVEILRNGEPVARLVAPESSKVRGFGTERDRFVVPDDFDAPLAPDVLETFTR
jgi:antitoxin (DNA-binding transcriptional repressor) of toxin-antitoxin stability system